MNGSKVNGSGRDVEGEGGVEMSAEGWRRVGNIGGGGGGGGLWSHFWRLR